MPDRQPERESDREQPRRDYLGRIVVGFLILAAILWVLTYFFG